MIKSILIKIWTWFLVFVSILVFVVAFPYFLVKFLIKKPIDYIKLKKEIDKQRKEVNEVLNENKKSNDIIDSLYNSWNDDFKSFSAKTRLLRRKQDNK